MVYNKGQYIKKYFKNMFKNIENMLKNFRFANKFLFCKT